MTRSLFLISGLMLSVVVALGACGGKTNNTADGGTDMAGQEDPNLCSGPGCVGASCTLATDCTEGTGGTATCWTTTLLNNAKYLTTPGGYCTRDCLVDSDCGTAKCVSLPGAGKKYCMAKCSSATRCRKPGYSCAYDGDSGGICFPNANFDCNPSSGDGICEFGPDKYLGGCIRVAYESDHGGICHSQCFVGTATCPDDTRGGSPAPAQQCIYLDTSLDSGGNPSPVGDKFRGNVCVQQAMTQTMPGQTCKFWSECTDGYQCDRYNLNDANKVCRQLCVQGTQGPPALRTEILTPMNALLAGNGCAKTSEGCANSVRAGAAEGSTGLCQPK